MLCQSNEVIAQQRATSRWKEWIPLTSQQFRLRNLLQITAYNVNATGKSNKHASIKPETTKGSFYYTLHLTTMSAPFYTSEKLESENPKWSEIEVGDLTSHINDSVNGIVVRMWLHREGEQDHVLTVWGIYFSGLVYLGPKPTVEPSTLKANTLVFHMHGGYFTAAECIKESPQKIRKVAVKMNTSDTRPSYSVSLLLRLHTIQQAIKKQMQAAQNLRDKISAGGFTASESRENAVLRRLLNKSRPKAPERQEMLRIRKQMELVRFRVSTLSEEKNRKQSTLRQLEKSKLKLMEANQDKGMELMARYENLHKDMEHLKEWKKSFIDLRETYLHTHAQLAFRRKQLISELHHIYPIAETSNKHTICNVHLPNSEDFAGHDEVMISVALGFVTHVVQMVSIFLQVPLRYPVIHFGSRSKIVDHIVEKIPEKDREFPLFSRGKDKLQFNYGVYLLNKNIAQLRWYFTLPTQDLRATLPNLSALVHLRPGPNMLETHQRTLSGSSLDLRSSSQNVSPVGSLQQIGGFRRQPPAGPVRNFEKGHRVTKSMGNSELEVKELGATTNLSYSLDKGLDEYEEIKKAEDTLRPAVASVTKQQSLSHVGSEPILTSNNSCNHLTAHGDHDAASSGDEAQKRYLQSWQEHGPAPICSDDDLEVQHNAADLKTNGNNVNGDCEHVGMKRLSGQENSELDDMFESSMVDSLLTRRTEALAQRTGSFNLVRSRHGSFIDDAPS